VFSASRTAKKGTITATHTSKNFSAYNIFNQQSEQSKKMKKYANFETAGASPQAVPH
jgi:hypothetical protein